MFRLFSQIVVLFYLYFNVNIINILSQVSITPTILPLPSSGQYSFFPGESLSLTFNLHYDATKMNWTNAAIGISVQLSANTNNYFSLSKTSLLFDAQTLLSNPGYGLPYCTSSIGSFCAQINVLSLTTPLSSINGAQGFSISWTLDSATTQNGANTYNYNQPTDYPIKILAPISIKSSVNGQFFSATNDVTLYPAASLPTLSSSSCQNFVGYLSSSGGIQNDDIQSVTYTYNNFPNISSPFTTSSATSFYATNNKNGMNLLLFPSTVTSSTVFRMDLSITFISSDTLVITSPLLLSTSFHCNCTFCGQQTEGNKGNNIAIIAGAAGGGGGLLLLLLILFYCLYWKKRDEKYGNREQLATSESSSAPNTPRGSVKKETLKTNNNNNTNGTSNGNTNNEDDDERNRALSISTATPSIQKNYTRNPSIIHNEKKDSIISPANFKLPPKIRKGGVDDDEDLKNVPSAHLNLPLPSELMKNSEKNKKKTDTDSSDSDEDKDKEKEKDKKPNDVELANVV